MAESPSGEGRADAPSPSRDTAFGLDLPGDRWMDLVREAESPPAPGSIGAYELLEQVGRGGQGIVYRARQPGTGRIIALKRLLAGSWATPQMRRRFEREIETAASLQHAALVTVLGMEVVQGQPLLAMEWIDGVPVDRWAAGRPPRAVVDVFVQVLEGIHHAHQRGVIHRDLKPSNVLVDAQDRPHVLDFGLAKPAGPVAAGQPLTLSAAFLGTPAYAAPEQLKAARDGTDVRSDVYSLGVILFEVLTGRLPYEVPESLAEAVHAIENTRPRRPSSIVPGLGRELDAITGKALAKEPARRYQSVDAFADDLRRWLAGEPVRAHPPSAGYELAKLVRRHRLPSALLGIIVLLVLAFAVGATVHGRLLQEERDGAHAARVVAQEESRRARSAEREAQRLLAEARAAQRAAEAEKDRGDAVLAFLLRDVISQAGPQGAGNELTLVRLLALAERGLGERFGDQPLTEAAIRATIGNVMAGMGRFVQAREQHGRALALRRAALGPAHADVAASLLHLARCEQLRGRFDAALTRVREALACLETLPEDHARTEVRARTLLARVLLAREEHAEARAELRTAYETCRLAPEATAGLRPDVLCALAVVDRQLGRLADAERAYRRAARLQSAARPPDVLARARIRIELAKVLLLAGRRDEAREELGRALGTLERRLGADHPETLGAEGLLASVARDLGDFDGATVRFRRALRGLRAALPEGHPDLLQPLNGLAHTLALAGDPAGAERLFREALAVAEARFGEESTYVARVLHHLGNTVADAGRPEEAGRLLSRAAALRKRQRTKQSPASPTTH